MKPLLVLALCALPALANADPGLNSLPSPYSVQETLDRLETVLAAKGIRVFARIDHAGEARAAGLELRPTQLLIFGHPKAGTPLMQASTSMALDLPMKVLAWQDSAGQVHVTWNSPEFLARRHGLSEAQGKPLAAPGALLKAALAPQPAQ